MRHAAHPEDETTGRTVLFTCAPIAGLATAAGILFAGLVLWEKYKASEAATNPVVTAVLMFAAVAGIAGAHKVWTRRGGRS